jgi:hypothetical protein
MVTDFQYVADSLDEEAAVLEHYGNSFSIVGQTNTAQRMARSAQELRKLAQWTRDKIGSEVNQIVKQDKEQWDGVTNALIDVVNAAVKGVSSKPDEKKI